jgi:hypothetical protein
MLRQINPCARGGKVMVARQKLLTVEAYHEFMDRPENRERIFELIPIAMRRGKRRQQASSPPLPRRGEGVGE